MMLNLRYIYDCITQYRATILNQGSGTLEFPQSSLSQPFYPKGTIEMIFGSWEPLLKLNHLGSMGKLSLGD